MSLLTLAKRHCQASKPAVCLKPFVRDNYGVGYDFVRDVAHGHRRPSQKLLANIAATHLRLFPSEPLPDFPRPGANPSLN